jgi:hypothetical protein
MKGLIAEGFEARVLSGGMLSHALEAYHVD